MDSGAFETIGGAEMITLASLNNFCPHLAQSIEVKIDGSGPNTITTWLRNIGLTTTMEKWSNREDGHPIQSTNLG